ncbi:selenium-dependent molybdenum cofactor biosynthesis protein YqeB [Acetobacterium bakii]|uniref:Molybdenum hydroxylase n=1 Tax=Acetobacterium bakii TaxID=52689 RepID=A0A0L6U5J9_9FIRM|nr:selenium-dependent molybdenum cofactor biosynthesis protein YqeB [Acetobacterium bakii]KNZ43607.1 molybdenum hydroxylase [Acetobacterium bakii]
MPKNISEYTNLVIVRGAGDIASGTICRLYQCGFAVAALEAEKPTVIRRWAAFASAVTEGEVTVEDLTALRCDTEQEIAEALETGKIPICVDPEGIWIKKLNPFAVVDAILAKKNIGTTREMAPIVIGLGPGFTAGMDVDAVIETNRGHDLGRVIYKGAAAENTGVPGSIDGYTHERVIRAPSAGVVRIVRDIGTVVKAGDCLAVIDGREVMSKIAGVVRGIIADGSSVFKGMKIADVDPRGNAGYCNTISDKARNLSGGVLEAIIHYVAK